MKIRLFLIFAILVGISGVSKSQKSLLQSGPMIGYCEMREAMLWVQTKESAKVKISYENIETKEVFFTNTVTTEKSSSFTAKLLADLVSPGTKYEYTLFINNKKINFEYPTFFATPKIWKHRGDAPDFSFIAGSGTYINEEKYDRPGKGYGGEYKIFESIANKKANFMLWLGDNTYYRESDWFSETGMRKRYTHTRSLPEMQKMLATIANYAIWDDHDYGPNDSDRSYIMKNTSLEIFKNFWANPTFGAGEIKGAITMFNYSDCDFFLLDNRFYRSPDKLESENKTVLGNEQLQWLKDALVNSNSNFKFVVMGGQFLSTSTRYETYSSNNFKKERAGILRFIEVNKIKNVIFISGDRHYSEISALTETDYPVYDITCSPLTSRAGSEELVKEISNLLQIRNSLIWQRNFTVFTVSGSKQERKLNIIYFDSNGKELYKYEIKPNNDNK